MTNVQKALKVFPLLALITLIHHPLQADDQGWINHSATFKTYSNLNLKFTKETRCHHITYTDAFLNNWQGGIVYNLTKKIYLAALYKRENTVKSTYTLAENRFTLETGWKTRLTDHLDFDWRLKTEVRRYEKGLAENHLRFRLRVRLRSSLQIGALQLKPFIATEPFADTLSDKIFRNRFYLGTLFPLSKNVELVINYIRQDTKNKETIHILNSGFNLKY